MKKGKYFFIVQFVMLNAFVGWAYQHLYCFLFGDLLDPDDNTRVHYALFNLASLGLTLIETYSAFRLTWTINELPNSKRIHLWEF